MQTGTRARRECEMENESVTERNKTQKRSGRVMSQKHTLNGGECKSRLMGAGCRGDDMHVN